MSVPTDVSISVLRDVLRVYDHRFLELDPMQRARLVEGTRRLIGPDGLDDVVRAGLPASARLRAFCVQHDLLDELERLIRDEVEGGPAGAVVVGGRIYAMYPFLRGVPRQDVDITGEVGVDHRLDGADWQGRRVRLRGAARLQRVATDRSSAEILLRERTTGREHRLPTAPRTGVPGGFELLADPAAIEPGRYDVHIAATALGVRREARFGAVRPDGVRTGPQRRAVGAKDVTLYFTRGGYLALVVGRDQENLSPVTRLLRRLLR
ncbi:hypothetical protein DMH08_12435 [Actinomadura sp. WAC 06369]|nr:hypothetical protein DMH08_12435 [Actinomadura sp. WAC 06369]